MTIFSPYTVGRVASRRSIVLPATVRLTRPSWGIRRSAMLMSPMTFSRLISPAWMFFGDRMTSCSTPSTRYRIRTSRSVGSMWMSEARSARAWVMRRLTILTIGPSSTAAAALSMVAMSSSAAWAASVATSWTD